MNLRPLSLDLAWIIICSLPPLQAQDLNDGLVAYYPFNGNADDESGNGNNGTVNGATLTTGRNGNTDGAYNFDGTDDYINAGDRDDFDFGTSDFSFSLWVKPQGENHNRYCLTKDSVPEPNSYGIGTRGSNLTL